MQPIPEVRDNPAERRFELVSGDDMAIVEYRLDDRVMVFEHTFVPESLRGRGLATRLIEAALASARARDLRVDPLCSSFVSYIKAHPETQDLLTDDARVTLGLAGR